VHRRGGATELVRRLVDDVLVAPGNAAEADATDETDARDAREGKSTRSEPEVTPCLFTLRSTVPFFEKLGFEAMVSIEDVPRPSRAELFFGKIIGRLAKDDECVAMQMDWETHDLYP
jgi:hypothetical protein